MERKIQITIEKGENKSIPAADSGETITIHINNSNETEEST